MFISSAYAQAADAAATTTAAAGGGSLFMQFIPLILIFVIFYFLLIRPQQKRIKEHNNMLDNLKKGDRVVTGGGIIGTIAKIEGAELQVEIADNVRVRVQKATIGEVLTKPEILAPDAANNNK